MHLRNCLFFTGFTKISRGCGHITHLHWEHCCKLDSLHSSPHRSRCTNACHDKPQPCTHSPQCTSCGGQPGGCAGCWRSRQRGDPHQESFSAGPVRCASLHVSQCIRSSVWSGRATARPILRRLCSSVLFVHRGHHTFLHRR